MIFKRASSLSSSGIDYRQGVMYFPGTSGSYTDYGFAANDAQYLTWMNWIISNTCCGNEPVLETLLGANSAAWRPNASRTVIVVTDEPVDCAEWGSSLLNLNTTINTLQANGIVVHAIARAGTWGSRCDPTLLPNAGGLFLDIDSPAAGWGAMMASISSAIVTYSNVVVRDPMPPELVPLPGTYPGGSWDGTELVWTFSAVGAGATEQMCFNAQVTTEFLGAVFNTAYVSADGITETASSPEPVIYISPTTTPVNSPTITQTYSHSPMITPTSTITPTYSFSPTVTVTLTPVARGGIIEIRGIYPNPFDILGRIFYTLKTNAFATFTIYNVADEVVSQWSEDGLMGSNVTIWQGTNSAGNRAASGVYIVRLSAEGVNGGSGEDFAKIVVAH